MAGNATVSNVFGTFGAVCWCVQLVPQIVLNYRRHSADGLSSGFMLFWAAAGIPMGVYNIVSKFNVALQVQPQILTVLSLVTWSQCLRYQRKWSLTRVLFIAAAFAALLAGVETALFFGVLTGQQHEIEWPLTLMAVLAATFLALGVLEQYLAIWKNRSVEGISFLFCGIDALGDVTSIISVAFEPSINILGFVMYGVEFLLWCGIFACGFWFRCIPWLRTRLDKFEQTSQSNNQVEVGAHAEPTFHDMPSSTSVFRTPSAEFELRERHSHRPDHYLSTSASHA